MSCIANDKQLLELLNEINKLRALGVGGLAKPVQLVICGSQTVSKMCLLEEISVWSPASRGFGNEVILHKGPTPSVKWSIVHGTSWKNAEQPQGEREFTPIDFNTKVDLAKMIEEAEVYLDIANRVSDDVLKIEIFAPQQVEMRLVDLPDPCDCADDQDPKIINDLIEKYTEDSKSVIVTLIDATSFDPQRKRTMEIITLESIKPDSKEELAYAQFLKDGGAHPPFEWRSLPFVMQIPPAQKLADADPSKEAKTPSDRVSRASNIDESTGVYLVAQRLNKIILEHVRRGIPSLLDETNQQILNRSRKLSKLGLHRPTLQKQRSYLLDISSGFERIVKQALTGTYVDEFFRDLDEPGKPYNFRRLRAVIWRLNEYFADGMLTRGSQRRIIDPSSGPMSQTFDAKNPYLAGPAPTEILRSDLQKEVKERIRLSRGTELMGSLNQFLMGALFQDHAQPWEGLAKMHMLNVWEAARYFISLTLQYLADSHTYASLMGTIVVPHLVSLKQKLLDKLDELTAHMKRGPPLPLGKAFVAKARETRSDRISTSAIATTIDHPNALANGHSTESITQIVSTLGASRDEPGFVAADIIDRMEAYYESTLTIFINNVAILGIENCLLEPLERTLRYQVINDIDDDQIQRIAAEPSHVTEERERLTKDIATLQTGLQVLSVSEPVEPSWASPPVLETEQGTSQDAKKGLGGSAENKS
ncbi:hypothetical protein BJX64DRAFT_274749 [Aspergillus heterothallicus]